MFEVGEYIVYGINGICRVEKICPSPFDPADTRLFYLLVPLKNPTSSTIYTPVDNQRVPMRRLMTREQIHSLIDSMPAIDELTVPIEKQRREIYRETIGALEPTGYVQVMKTVHRRRAELTAAHKHFLTFAPLLFVDGIEVYRVMLFKITLINGIYLINSARQ